MSDNKHEHIHDENCDCGHDHGHEHKHDENCECGHDHDHGHNHVHDENCDCGHDHDHNHVHDENCDCGHDHDGDHNHEHAKETETENKPGFSIKMTTHDEAVIGSLSATIHCSLDEAQKAVSEKMANIANKIADEGGIVGHIKSHIIQETGVVLSTTDGSVVNATQLPMVVCKAQCVFIIMLFDLNRLEEMIEEEYSEYK